MVDEAATRLEDLFEIVDDTQGAPSVEFVPHKNGRVKADRQVALTVRVTAKERYLWSLEAARRGKTMTDIVRSAFNRLLQEEHV